MNGIAERLATVRDRIAQAEARRGDGSAVTLVGVSKKQPLEAVRAAAEAGLRDFGENYAQELRDKREGEPEPSVRWHFIGPVQSNKAKLVVGIHRIHTVDRPSLIAALDSRARQLGIDQAVLVQVNIAREPQKAGVDPHALGDLLDRFADCERVRCTGLMLIPPLGIPESTREHFRALRRLAEELAIRTRPRVELDELSMGMSDDFEVAIEEGATLIRVGTAIFGPRDPGISGAS